MAEQLPYKIIGKRRNDTAILCRAGSTDLAEYLIYNKNPFFSADDYDEIEIWDSSRNIIVGRYNPREDRGVSDREYTRVELAAPVFNTQIDRPHASAYTPPTPEQRVVIGKYTKSKVGKEPEAARGVHQNLQHMESPIGMLKFLDGIRRERSVASPGGDKV